MTSRSGLHVALVGLVVAGLCFSILGLLAVFEESVLPSGSTSLIAFWGIILLDVGLALGLIVMMAGLVMAGVLALTKQRGKPV